MKCPTCGIGNLVAATRNMAYTYKGKKTVIKAVRGEYCGNPKCREVVMDMGESARTSAEVLAFNKKVNAALTPIELLARVRKQLDLTQQKAAKIFGGGPNAFSRYESGKTKPPVALVTLFRVLQRHPDLYGEVVNMADSIPARTVAAKRRRRPTSARAART